MTGESMSRPSRRTTNPVNSQSTSATEDEDSATTGIQVSMEVATSSSLATFIKKLWIIVNDANLQSLIHWSDAGDVICIPNVTVFSKRVLPKYFKHGNWQSFVRQLNMYGFRRVYSPTPSPLTAHHTRTSAASTWPDQSGPMSMMLRSASSYQFMNENFVRDDSQKLVNIKRKAGSNRQTNAARQQKQQQQQQQQEQQQATDDTESQGQSQSQRGAANHVPISTEVAEQLQERVSHLLEQLTDTEKKLELMQSEAHSIKQIQIQQQQLIQSLVDSAGSMFKEKGAPEHQLQLIQNSLERLKPFIDRLGGRKEIREDGGAGSSGSGSRRDNAPIEARPTLTTAPPPKLTMNASEVNGRADSYPSLPHKRRWSHPSQELLTGPRPLPVPQPPIPPPIHRLHAADEPRLPPISEAISNTSTRNTTLPPLSSTPETIQTQPTPTSEISPTSPFQLPPLGRKPAEKR